MEQDKLSHLDKDGSANMVDISEKNIIYLGLGKIFPKRFFD